MTLQVENKKSNWPKKKKKCPVQRCCYLWKETLVQERAGLSSAFALWALPPRRDNTASGLTTHSRHCSMHFSYANNPMREIWLLSPFTDEETEVVRDSLFAQGHRAIMGSGWEVDIQQKSGSRPQALTLSTLTLFDALLLTSPLSSFPPANVPVHPQRHCKLSSCWSPWSGETPARFLPSQTFPLNKDKAD